MSHYTPEQIAEIHNISPRQIKIIAKKRKIGAQLVNGAWVFHKSDIDKLKPTGKTGRPRKE